MIKVNANGETLSSDYYAKINSASRHFELKLTDVSTGTDLDLTYKKASFHRGSCGGSLFAIGCAYAAYIEVTARYDSMMLEGRKVLASIGVLMDNDTYEWVKIGTFMIQKPVKEKDMMTFTAVDAMLYAIVGDYASLLSYPATINQVIAELEQTYNVDIVLKAAIGSCTLTSPIAVTNVRGVIQTLATLSLGYAYVNSDGQIVIDYFNRQGDVVDLDFDLVKTQPTMDERATLIDGIKVQATTDTSNQPQIMFEYPTSGVTHAVVVGCPYMTQQIFDIVKLNFVGFTYSGGEVQFMGNPLLEPSDTLVFKGNSDEIIYNIVTHTNAEIETDQNYLIGAQDYVVFNMACMEISYDFDGGLTTTVTAPGSFEQTEETTQGGVLSQLSMLEQSSGQSVSQLIAGARATAKEAQTIADNTNQYFWHTTVDDGSGVGTGAHITEIPQAEFVRDPENGGGNLLARSNGIAIRDGLIELAQFAGEFIRLLNSQSLPIFEASRSGTDTIKVVDSNMLIPRGGTGTLTVPMPYGEPNEILLVATSGSTPGTATLNYGTAVTGQSIGGATYDYDGDSTITVHAPSSATASAVAIAEVSADVPYFTLGSRSGYAAGYSSAIGNNLIASENDQVVIGRFNEEVSDKAFVIGNGTGELVLLPSVKLNRSNALTVDWDGNLDCTNHKVGCVERGTDGYWTWYKYSDGSFDMYRHTTATITSYWSSSPLNGYYADYTFPADCQPADTEYGVYTTWKIGTGFGIGADTGSKTTSGFRTYGLGTASGSQTCIIDVHVHGKY